MPVDFLSETQRAAYSRYAGEPSAEQLARYFHLDAHDRSVIATRRGDENRLGFAVQLGTVRFLGIFLPRPTEVPDGVVRFVATQLGIRDTTSFARYAQRTATHREHASEIQKRYGYRPSSDPAESFQLLRWLYTRATLSAERPSVLFDRATARLVERKVLLPGVTVLERLVSSVRNRAVKRLWCLLSALPTPEQRATLDAMLLVPEASRRSNLDRLRRSPTTISARSLCQALERLSEIEKLGLSDLDFSRIPPGRVDALARQANAARAQAIARMPDDRRIATLVAFVSRLERTACDDALNLMDLELAKLLTEAERAGKAKRKKTLQTFDQAAVLLRDALLIVLDPTQEDLEHVREQLYARASHEELVEAVACVDQIARPHGTHHYEELISRYRSVRLFLPKLLELPFEGLPAGQIVLGGLAAVRTLEGRRRIGRDEIPGTLVTPTWERSVFVEPDQVERRSFTFCVLEQLRSALRRRDVFVSKSTQWGDPRAQLLGPDSWGKARTSTCRMLGLSSTPEPFLENIGRELDESYRRTGERWRQNAAVRIEAAGEREELVLTGLDGLEDPPSLVELRTLTERMLPQVDLPELLLEVNAWTGFADAFTHVSETRSRIPDLPTSVCAALIADACNIALEPLVRKDTPALTRGRLSWIKQNYFRAETLIQANAALVDCQMTIPLAQHWGGGEVASADGLRFVVPVRTLNAGPNPRYFGTGRGVTYYNFTSDQFTGFHAIVVPGTIRDSLYVLDGLLEHETSLEVQEIVTDTAAYSDLIFGLFRLLGFQFSPRLADLGRTRFWRINRRAEYGLLNSLARSRINLKLIRSHWDDILLVAGSLVQGTVRASELIRALQRGGRPSSLARAISEIGRIAKTLHLLAYIDDEAYRRRILRQINRGEGRHSVARAVFFGKRGELRRRYKEGQEDQLGALGLVVNAIVLWNTRYMDAVLSKLQADGDAIADADARRLSPLVHKHLNFLGRYHFSLPGDVRGGELRELRDPNAGLEQEWLLPVGSP